ncbi:putative Dynein beta chain: CLUMA_CG011410, isoform A, partial [Gryllus bimaculatus]
MDNPVDTRLEYVGKYVTKSLRLKPDKWGRLLAVDEQRDQVLEFLNRPDLTVMLVLQNTAATLTIVTGFPASIKSKAVYFIKKNAQAVTKDNMEDLLIPGDIAPKAIEHLACLVEEVFVPILSNPDNHTTWPAAVAQDIHMHVHGLKSTVYQVKGQVTGQTVLAMPVGVERIVDLYLKSAIEGVIIKWATQINDVITEDSAQAFANGNNPVPYEALAEAQDISLYLKPLLRHFKVVEETDFSELSPHLMPLVHVVCLVWSNSRYYCTSSKIIILLRQICNLLIQQAKKYLDPSSIFQSDVMEAKERIKDVVTTLTMFRKVFDNRREKIATYFEDREPVLWNFHPNMVFERFNAFLARLATIELIEIVGTVLDRPLIEREFTAKYAQVLDRLDQDVAVSEELYEEQMREYSRSGSMPVDVHMPPVAGAMRWARMLARRDAFSVQRFRELNH